jgi:hypothetical protein
MPTPNLFDFDTDRLAGYDPVRVDRALREHSAIYVNHLQVAQWLQGWAERLDEQADSRRDDTDFIRALREVAAHLRQADLVPGGPLLDEDAEGRHDEPTSLPPLSFGV